MSSYSSIFGIKKATQMSGHSGKIGIKKPPLGGVGSEESL
jgi:hypothetical protein